MFDGSPIPPCQNCEPPSPIESFLGLWIAFWLLFWLTVYILPTEWSDVIWRIVFPFWPRKNTPN